MDAQPQTIVFLHGLGVGPECWDAQIAALPAGFTPVVPRILPSDGRPFSLSRSVDELRGLLDAQGVGRAHLCGLSLGAVVATRFAAAHPDRVSSLTLSGGQVRPSPALMRLQRAIIALLPARLAAPAGVDKATMLQVLDAIAALDLRDDLPRITAPTLVLCGARDRPNLGAARELARGIPRAELQVVPGAGHEWNTQLPAEFTRRLGAFLRGPGSAAG
ncbi:alpha/beta fold hydrolase [Microbacterium marinilacus]|uniref:Alpha/beta hydrolase n=1 Tax=Microbacterium marinilacus TaxID=415209 RepID=A0ABP7BJA0_9MICO|nr:alpha/beta hydrolase [Microbacterium marinilacus]MBY0690311.1 alpha/beta hydrolase [Microbacterium marinilacus]